MTRIVAALETLAAAVFSVVVVALIAATYLTTPAEPDHWRL
jgi:hypothetical protein